MKMVFIFNSIPKKHIIGRPMCDVYWPDKLKSEIKFNNNLIVKNTKLTMLNDFLWIREFEIKNTSTNETRPIVQYHTVGWPDQKTPPVQYTDCFEGLLMTTLDLIEEDAKNLPFVVHCSAGIGRTGTFIGL